MYVINYHKQIEKIREMVPLRKNDKTLEVFYHDPQSGELWKSFFPDKNSKISSVKLLRPEPLPQSIQEQLALCLNQKSTTDAKGLAIEYSQKGEYWDEIISELEKNRSKYRRKNIRVFIDHLGILGFEVTAPTAKKEVLSDFKRRAQRIKIKTLFFIR